MATRHEYELLSRLEGVIDKGYTEINKAELLIWNNQERITYLIWKDIVDKWYQLLETTAYVAASAKKSPLLVADSTGKWLFIWGEGLTCSDRSWFKDVRSLAKIKFEAE